MWILPTRPIQMRHQQRGVAMHPVHRERPGIGLSYKTTVLTEGDQTPWR